MARHQQQYLSCLGDGEFHEIFAVQVLENTLVPLTTAHNIGIACGPRPAAGLLAPLRILVATLPEGFPEQVSQIVVIEAKIPYIVDATLRPGSDGAIGGGDDGLGTVEWARGADLSIRIDHGGRLASCVSADIAPFYHNGNFAVTVLDVKHREILITLIL